MRRIGSAVAIPPSAIAAYQNSHCAAAHVQGSQSHHTHAFIPFILGSCSDALLQHNPLSLIGLGID